MGPSPFVDGDDSNDFFGTAVLAGGERVHGELASVWAGTGGGSGGDCSRTAVWPMTLPAGKPVVSVPPFMVITFECTVLIGGLMTLLGLLYHCRLPALNLEFELCDPRYTSDHFGLVLVGLSESDRSKAGDIIRDAGAVEVVDNVRKEAASG